MKGRWIAQWLLAGLWCLPLLFLLGLSLSLGWVFPDIMPETWTIDHWRDMGRGEVGLRRSLASSLVNSLSVAATVTFLSFLTSRYLAYHPRGRAWMILAYFPYVVAPVILAACWQYFFLVADLSGKWVGVWLAQVLITYPFGVIFFSGFWNEEKRQLEDLVATLGGTTRQTLWKVLWPISRGALLVCFFQTFLISWFEYGLTMLIGVGKVQTLTVRVFEYVNEANSYLAALSGVLLFVPPLLLLYVNKRFVFNQTLR
jgi:putative spermidine/putrescine transport system permease protein